MTSARRTSSFRSLPTAPTCMRARSPKRPRRYFGNRFDVVAATDIWGRSLAATTTDNMIELDLLDRKRIFNLGYFTWVEQQGVSLEEFSVR